MAKRKKVGRMVHGARKVFNEYDFWEAMRSTVISRPVGLPEHIAGAFMSIKLMIMEINQQNS